MCTISGAIQMEESESVLPSDQDEHNRLRKYHDDLENTGKEKKGCSSQFVHLFIPSFLHAFIQQMFFECPLQARSCDLLAKWDQ